MLVAVDGHVGRGRVRGGSRRALVPLRGFCVRDGVLGSPGGVPGPEHGRDHLRVGGQAFRGRVQRAEQAIQPGQFVGEAFALGGQPVQAGSKVRDTAGPVCRPCRGAEQARAFRLRCRCAGEPAGAATGRRR